MTNSTNRAPSASRIATAVVVALGLLLAPLRLASADPRDDARAHYQKGSALYAAGSYREAIAEFVAADKLAPAPLLHYNIALAHERLGEWSEAAKRYRAYVEAAPDAANRAEVEAKIKRLDAQANPTLSPYPELAPPAATPVPVPVPPVPAPPAAAPPAGAPPKAPTPGASTGDPELDRVAGIDVRAVRDQRRASGEIPGGVAAPPSPSASAAVPPRGGEPTSAPAAPPSDKPAARPIYKQWWFWVVVGVSALVLVNIASSDADDGDASARRIRGMIAPDVTPDHPGGGAVILRF